MSLPHDDACFCPPCVADRSNPAVLRDQVLHLRAELARVTARAERAEAAHADAVVALSSLFDCHAGPLAPESAFTECLHGQRRNACGLCDDDACHGAHDALATDAAVRALARAKADAAIRAQATAVCAPSNLIDKAVDIGTLRAALAERAALDPAGYRGACA